MALNDTDELLSLIKQRGSIPTASPDWTDTRLLLQASKELLDIHLPMLLAARGEYLVKIVDIPLVAGQRDYRLPDRCAAVRQVSYLQSDGTISPISEAKPAELEEFTNTTTQGRPARFTFREHFLELSPVPASSSDSIRVRFHIRPSRMVPNDNSYTRAIVAIVPDSPAPGQTSLFMGGLPGVGFGATFDLVKSKSPFDIMAFDLPVNAIPGNIMVVDSTSIPQGLVAGDYVAIAGYTVFPNCPEELHHAIALRAAAAVVTSKGDGLAKALIDEATVKERSLLTGVLAPRSKGNPKTIRSRRWG